MIKKELRFVVIVLVFLCFSFQLYANNNSDYYEETRKLNFPSASEISDVFSVFADSIACVIASQYSEPVVFLQGTDWTVNQKTQLIEHITFEKSDISLFKKTISDTINKGSKSFLGNLLQNLSLSAKNPLLVAVNLYLLTHSYRENDYILTGSVDFSFSEGADKDRLLSLLKMRPDETDIEDTAVITVDLTVKGNKMTQPLNLKGKFIASAAKGGGLLIKAADNYYINNYLCSGGEFRF